MKKTWIYAGSVGTPESIAKGRKKSGSISGLGEGVYSLFMKEDFSLEKRSVAESDNAGIICRSNNGKFIYAANESRDFTGFNGSGGGVTALRIKKDGTLEKINDSISYGSRSSYVAVSDDDRYLFVSNHGSHSVATCRYVKNEEGEYILNRGYDDSSLAVFSLNEDGSIGKLLDLKVFKGHGYWINGGGQSGPHLHSVRYHKGLIFCGNRGSDEIEVLRLKDSKFELLNSYKTRPASAPRHIDFHPSKDLIYVSNENYPCVSVYKVNYETGELKELDFKATMDPAYMEQNPLPHYEKDTCSPNEANTSAMADFSKPMPSDIHVRPDGRFCYVANRVMKGISSIAAMKIEEDGSLSFVGLNLLEGGDPRGFNLIDNEHLIVGLLDKDKVMIYQLGDDGMFVNKISQADVPSCASFVCIREE